MRFFLINLLLIVSFSSCKSITKNFISNKKNELKIYKNTYFADSSKDYIYKAKIDIYGNYFGGIAVFKKINDNHHRIVFTTEFGAKMFDIEIKNGELIKNSVVKQMDRKIIVNTLKKDFEILLKENNIVKNNYISDNQYIYQSEVNNRYNFHYVNQSNNNLTKIINSSKYKEKVTILFSEINNGNPKKIAINHHNIKLKIDLKNLK